VGVVMIEDVIGVVAGIDVEMVYVEGLSVEDWDKIGDVGMGKYVGICDEDVKVDISEFFDVLDIESVGIHREVGVIGNFMDVSDVVMGVFDVDVDKGLDMIGWGMID
ncbi:hypothetical protein KI387_031156, partial [Taxus chinensis]